MSIPCLSIQGIYSEGLKCLTFFLKSGTCVPLFSSFGIVSQELTLPTVSIQVLTLYSQENVAKCSQINICNVVIHKKIVVSNFIGN